MIETPRPSDAPDASVVRILLLEDDADFATIVRHRLNASADLAVTVDWAPTLGEALARLERRPADLILADLGLPDSSGLSTLDRLRSAGERLIVVLTGLTDPELHKAALARGAYDVVHKDRLDGVGLERLVRLAALQARTVRSLQRSEERFRKLTELSADWYWEQDEQFRFTLIAGPRAAANARGGDPSVYLGTRRWEAPDLEPVEGDWEAHIAALERHEPFRDLRLRRRMDDGTLRYMSVSGEPVYDEAGRFAGYRGVASDITDRVRAEERSREAAAALRLIADNVPAMIAYYDREVRLRYANRRHAEFYGYALEDKLGRHMREVIGEAAWAEVRPHFERAYAGETLSYERAVPRAGGEAVHIHVDFVPQRSPSGAIEGLYVLVTDVTEARRTEALLRTQAGALRQAQILARMISLEWDVAADRITWSRPPEWLLGPPPAPGGYPLFREMVHPEDRARFLRDRDRALRTGCEHNAEYRIVRTDGEVRWVSARGSVFLDAQGRAARMSVALQDVTERKRAEEALRLRNRALDASVNAVMITEPRDGDQVLVYVNPAFERMTGYRAGEALGRNPRFLSGADREQAGTDALRAAVREQREATVLLRNYRRDGTPFWNELHVAPVPDEHGRITHFVGISSDVTERVRYQEEIERQANYDTLTGLPNRNLLHDRLAQAILKAARSGRPLGVMFIDLDHLKRINDTLGHAVGDRVIALAARRIAGAVRGGDTVARLSGDEFIALLPDLQRDDDAAVVAAKLRAAVGAPLRVDAHEFVLTASIGIALYPKDGTDAATLLKHADAALYRAKEEGRDRFRFFAPELNARVVRHMAMERALREALAAGEFRLAYQPVVRLRDGAVVGAEALIRWQRADGTVHAPEEFIPVAEESGLIVPIGRWVLEAAARQARLWNRARTRKFHVSVNLSARQFRDPELLASIRTALRAARADPALVQFEITESMLVQDQAEAAAILRALRRLGSRVAVDDFGTGYSSLAYLKRLPLDTLKIDRSFVRGVPRDPADLALVRAVIRLAEGLGLDVVAEGVETRAQAAALAREGCRFAQGYWFGRPMPAEQIRAGAPARGRKRPRRG
jgi:diguanylate cyclase (GGDEF)-like protein/PAS domain S-box-containing protein